MKIVSLNGLLGYGYAIEGLERAMTMDIDYIGVDAGSSDPGPFYLGNGTSFTNRDAVKRDVELVLPYALNKKIPLIIGTAGGSGGNVHVQWMREIIEEIAIEQKLSFKMAIIQSEVTREYVKEKLRAGKIINMGPGLELTEEIIDRCNRIVSQIGIDPYLKALESDADVILAGRSCDTAIFAAPAIKAGMDWGLAFHMAKIIECGALCSIPMAASDIMVAEIEKDSFTLEPANPIRRCTIERVAAHTMYEQNNPYYIYEPDGVIDLKETRYEQISDRAVRVANSQFIEAEVKTLKLEGTMLAGYRTITIAGINDPETIKRVDTIFGEAKEFIASNMKGKISSEDYVITLRKYGEALPDSIPQHTPSCNLGIIVDVVAKTQNIANTICALARARLLHTDYQGRKSTAGNLAFPYSPSDIICGPVYTFGIYHLAKVDDLCETSSINYVKVGE
ncbi:MAG: 3-methylaspartate ammonia-lyase [Firmicutes bacterium]|nr:3-methylaspartate ammonia-lyase [Bacillota bacterium]